MATISLVAEQIGDVLTFTVISAAPNGGADTPLNLSGATVTWMANNGVNRVLTIASAGSGTATYTTSAADFPHPTRQTGQLRISFTSTRFFTRPAFDLVVMPNKL